MGDAERNSSLIGSMRVVFLLGFVLMLHSLNVISICTLSALLLACLLIFVVGPFTYRYSHRFRQSTIFLNFVTIPLQADVKNPGKYGLKAVLNFYLKTNDDVTLGVWHIAHEDAIDSCDGGDEEHYRSALGDGRDVVLYCHGNAGNRSVPHRVEMYAVLRKQFHVIAFDYRSYGDSTPVPPSERGLVDDSLFVFKWVRGLAKGNVFVWGHSLGTAISTHMLHVAAVSDLRSVGLILESPFNNMQDELRLHPFTKLFRSLPWFRYCVLEPIKSSNLLFQTDEHINNVDCPVLILHAKDDVIVPFQLGLKLYKSAKENRLNTQGEVRFHQFEESLWFGHKYICRSPDLGEIIRSFVVDCLTTNGTD